MKYPIVQYTSNQTGSTSTFKGLNRTPKGQGGEWVDMDNLDVEEYPCLSPRFEHSSPFDLSLSDSLSGKVCAVAEVMRDTGEYQGFTGVLLYDTAIMPDGTTTEKNFVFVYNGEIKHVGQEPTSHSSTVPTRTALWQYTKIDDVTDDEVAAFKENMERVIWTVTAIGGRYAINGYDPVLKRGRYFTYNTKKIYDTGSSKLEELERTVVPSDEQITYSSVTFGTKTTVGDKVCYIRTTDENNKFSDKFSEGDYLLIRTEKGYNDVFPYSEHGSDIKYAVIKEIDSDTIGDNFREFMYYYATDAAGRKHTNTSQSNVSATLGVFVPPMNHIAAFGKRIWGVNPEEDAVYSSVFDTPFKMINTDAQLDNAMSWQTVLGTADEAVGVCAAVSEMLVMKKNSIMRISGTNASNFMIAGIYKNCGCIDIRSCAECAGTVFYLGRNGFYAYSGAQPTLISTDLHCTYTSAVCTTDGVKYYASAIRADNGSHEFLIYHIRSGAWYKWNSTPEAAGFCRIGTEVYEAYNTNSGGKIIGLCAGPAAEPWQCESVVHFEGSNTQKAVNELWIRAELKAPMTVYTSVNGEAWTTHKPLEPKGRIFCYKVPVRLSPGDYWQYKLESADTAVIHNIERAYEEGGGRHYVY